MFARPAPSVDTEILRPPMEAPANQKWRPTGWPVVTAVLAIAVIALTVWGVSMRNDHDDVSAEAATQIDDLEQQLADSQEQVADLEQQLADTQEQALAGVQGCAGGVAVARELASAARLQGRLRASARPAEST